MHSKGYRVTVCVCLSVTSYSGTIGHEAASEPTNNITTRASKTKWHFPETTTFGGVWHETSEKSIMHNKHLPGGI